MKKTTANKNSMSVKNLNASKSADGQVEVLYQKLGDRWFAFSLIDDEVFLGSMSSDEIENAQTMALEKVNVNDIKDQEPSA